jgi:hypothetical protein
MRRRPRYHGDHHGNGLIDNRRLLGDSHLFSRDREDSRELLRPQDTIQVSLEASSPHPLSGTLPEGECGGHRPRSIFAPLFTSTPDVFRPPGLGALNVGSVAVDSAAVDYTVSSSSEATLHLTVPGGIDVPATVSPPGEAGTCRSRASSRTRSTP